MREIMSFSGEIYNGSKKFYTIAGCAGSDKYHLSVGKTHLRMMRWLSQQRTGLRLHFVLVKISSEKEQYSMNMKWVIKFIRLAKVAIIETDLFQLSLKGQIWIDCSWSIIRRIKISSYLCVIFRLKHPIICDISPVSHFHCHVTFANALKKAMPTFLEGSRPRRKLMFDG